MNSFQYGMLSGFFIGVALSIATMCYFFHRYINKCSIKLVNKHMEIAKMKMRNELIEEYLKFDSNKVRP